MYRVTTPNAIARCPRRRGKWRNRHPVASRLSYRRTRRSACAFIRRRFSRNVRRCRSSVRSLAWISPKISVGRMPKVYTSGFERETRRRSNPGPVKFVGLVEDDSQRAWRAARQALAARALRGSSASRPRCRLTSGGIGRLRESSIGLCVIGRTRTRSRPSATRRKAVMTTQGRSLRPSVSPASASRLHKNDYRTIIPRKGVLAAPQAVNPKCSRCCTGILAGSRSGASLRFIRHVIKPHHAAVELLQPLILGGRGHDD